MSNSIDRHMPMHLRRKVKAEKPKPKTFELMPPTGVLMPGQRVNIQVKFMPTEEVGHQLRYTNIIIFIMILLVISISTVETLLLC